jgi:hypothetical protein
MLQLIKITHKKVHLVTQNCRIKDSKLKFSRPKLLGKGSGLFRLERESGRVFLNGSLNLEANDEKFYLRLRATDKAGHITESQLVIHVLKEQDTPPIVRGLAVIDGNFVTLGQDGKHEDISLMMLLLLLLLLLLLIRVFW